MKAESGWYMSSTSNVDEEYRETIGHIEGLAGIRPTALNVARWWCLDNSVFTGKFEEKKWLKIIDRLCEWRNKCLFVTIPDVLHRMSDGSVVGDCSATLAQFSHYRNMVKDFPVALVSQDGIANQASKIPWDDFDCLFIGGSNEHKLGHEGRWILEEAKKRGKWVHVGRVNSRKRMNIFWEADSWDGTKPSFEPSYIKKFHGYVLEIREKKKGVFNERKGFHFNTSGSLYGSNWSGVLGA